MKRALSFLFGLVCLLFPVQATASCQLDFSRSSPDVNDSRRCFFPLNLFAQTVTKTQYWDGYFVPDCELCQYQVAFTNWPMTGTGECWGQTTCWPEFFGAQHFSDPVSETSIFSQRIKSYRAANANNGGCITTRDHFDTLVQNCPIAPCEIGPLEKEVFGDTVPLLPSPSCCSDWDRLECFNGGGEWVDFNCSCTSPIVIDVAGNGFNLTNPTNGVPFDIAGNGVAQQISWTSANSDDAWLALDRNGNGTIDDGRELFGSSSLQPYLAEGESKNGFRALALFDRSEYGGNSDGQIDFRDTVFSNLKLWQDRNHNGVSEAGELQSLSDSEVRVIELNYRESKRQDEHGNWFRYRAKVRDARGAQVGRWAWDVFLHTTNFNN